MSNPTSNPRSSFQRLSQDVIDLFELQWELLSVDAQEAKRKLVRAAICGGIAATLAGSALTVVMIGTAFLLAEMTQLSNGGALLIAGGVFFSIVALLGWIAAVALQSAAAAMSESKSEFSENLRWLKATLVNPDTSPRNQIRRESFPDDEPAEYPDSSWDSAASPARQRNSPIPR
ncbi:hypothetical protein Pla52o_14210 [Novipirellula galeiformis]|uniref:Phage holin family protein n=1 Tax=Novipirellula galeiformis TaxID=2528004 RepID=A0A5C6CJT7_9BACT|nr:phage holin family protein [Novipirellula galeiformis]TWU25123.1 hypothetical protein Pla52o_14210 [Novipirellula galeiformis]